MLQKPSVLLWLRQDLRLADHPALHWAAMQGVVVPVYILEDNPPHPLGGASKWWLQEALRNLEKSFGKLGLNLVLRHGDPEKVLTTLVKETGAKAITWTCCYEPTVQARDEKLAKNLEAHGLTIRIHRGYTLCEPGKILTGGGTPFKVFTPFSKACFAAGDIGKPLPVPTKLENPGKISSDRLEDWHLVPRTAKWPKNLAETWDVSEDAAHQRLHGFINEALSFYKSGRDRPDQNHTSRLSPYLHFGQIGPRQVWQAIQSAYARQPALGANAERYLLELLWREFSWHLLHHFPFITDKPLVPSFAAFPWQKDAAGLKAWQQGRTGYPIVDAGMRQLWQTGWMHNRVRMIVASFLIKDLLIDWREGMAWFWDTLVDADLASNTASWQWVAGCGADAAPYFRIFNPTLQGQKFDPHGNYVRQFVPELANLEANYIHEPWKAPASLLAKAGVILGKTYPQPIVDHAKARQRALAALAESKNQPAQHAETKDLFD